MADLELLEIDCPNCNARGEVQAQATAWRCTNCGDLWRFFPCSRCKEPNFVRDSSRTQWVCSSCGQRHGAFAAATNEITVPPQRRPAAATLDAGGRVKGAAALAVVGGLIAIVGSMLPWISATSGFGSLSKSGLEGGDGVIALVIGALAIVTGVCAVAGWTFPRLLQGSAVVQGAVLLAIAAFDYVDVQHRIKSVDAAGNGFVTASTGAGLWALFVAGALVLAAGIIIMAANRSPVAPALVPRHHLYEQI